MFIERIHLYYLCITLILAYKNPSPFIYPTSSFCDKSINEYYLLIIHERFFYLKIPIIHFLNNMFFDNLVFIVKFNSVLSMWVLFLYLCF